MKINISKVSANGSSLDVVWDDGEKSNFNYLWLRDNCPTAHDKDSRHRMFNILNISTNIKAKDFKVNDDGKLMIQWSEGDHTSYYDPNWFVMQINLNPWPNCDRSHYKPEYKSYDKDPVIGGRQIETLEQSLWLTVAHEVSHYVQYRHCPRIKRFRGKYQKSHGDCFKQIYRYLRRDFINPMLDG